MRPHSSLPLAESCTASETAAEAEEVEAASHYY